MKRLSRFWNIDLIRQSSIAFLVSAAVMSVVVGAAFALDSGTDPQALDYSGSNDQSNDSLNKVAVRNYATLQGKQAGRVEAERDLAHPPGRRI